MTAEPTNAVVTVPEARHAIIDVLVSVINYRTADMTIACVRSVLEDVGDLDVHVVVIDNRSDDGSAEVIEAWIATLGSAPRVSLLRSATNAGYAGGHNQGIASRPARTAMILNSDALVRPGAIAALFAALQRDPGLGMVAPRLEDEDGTPQISCFRFASPLSELARGAQIGPLSRLLARWNTALSTTPDPRQIDWVSGACILKRAEMIAAIGPMDEGYFMYFEDADYCLRARRGGWRVALAPEARVVHLRGGSAPVKALNAARKRLPAYFYASRTRFLYRAHGRAGLLAANVLWWLGRGLNFTRYLIGDPPRRIAGEPADLWINFADPLGDRRAPEV